MHHHIAYRRYGLRHGGNCLPPLLRPSPAFHILEEVKGDDFPPPVPSTSIEQRSQYVIMGYRAMNMARALSESGIMEGINRGGSLKYLRLHADSMFFNRPTYCLDRAHTHSHTRTQESGKACSFSLTMTPLNTRSPTACVYVVMHASRQLSLCTTCFPNDH